MQKKERDCRGVSGDAEGQEGIDTGEGRCRASVEGGARKQAVRHGGCWSVTRARYRRVRHRGRRRAACAACGRGRLHEKVCDVGASASFATNAMLYIRLHRCCTRLSLQPVARSFTSLPSLPPLPPQDEWRKTFPHVRVTRRDRVFLRSPEAARSVANSLFTTTPATNGKGKVVVEAFPGPSNSFVPLPVFSFVT